MKRILIVGAGAAGLSMALSLRQHLFHGEIHLIDKLPAPLESSRALVIHSTTLEALAPYGMTQKLLAAGMKIDTIDFYSDDEKIGSLDRKLYGGRYPFFLMLSQAKTEELLEKELALSGIRARRGCELIQLEKKGHDLVVILRDEEKEWEERFDFVIGADGAHSAVRELMGIPFIGERHPISWHLADLEMSAPPRFTIHLDSIGVWAHLPFAKNASRTIASGGTPFPHFEKEPFWETSFHIAYRFAAARRKGFVFLIGDAFSIHSPVFGRGMNNAILEGLELGALISRDASINSWEKRANERAAHIVQLTKRATYLIENHGPFTHILRRNLIQFLLKFEWGQKLLLKYIID